MIFYIPEGPPITDHLKILYRFFKKSTQALTGTLSMQKLKISFNELLLMRDILITAYYMTFEYYLICNLGVSEVRLFLLQVD